MEFSQDEQDSIQYLKLTIGEFKNIWQSEASGIIKTNGSYYWREEGTDGQKIVVFKNIQIVEDFSIVAPQHYFLGINLIDSKFKSILISNKSIGDIIIENSEVSNLEILGDSNIGKISITNNSKVNKITLIQLNLKGLQIQNCSDIEQIFIDNSEHKEPKSLGKIEIEKTLINQIFIKKAIIEDIEVKNKSEIQSFHIGESSSTGNIEIDESNINNFLVFNSTTKCFIVRNESITGDFNFFKSTIEHFIIENKSIIGNFNLTNSISGKIKILKESTTGNFLITDKSTTEAIIIDNNKLCGYFMIQDSISQDFVIKNKSIVGDIITNKSLPDSKQIFGELKIEDSITGNLLLNETEVDNINISESKIAQIKLERVSIKKQLSILSNSSIWKLLIQGKEIKRVVLENSYLQYFEWKQDSFCMLNIQECKIEDILFERCAIPKDSVFQISDTSIGRFKCYLFVNTAWFNISNLYPIKNYQRFIEQKVDDNGEEILENQESERKFKEIVPKMISNNYQFEQKGITTCVRLENSDLGKTSFIDCKLNEFDEFIYYNTKMLEIYVGGTKIPTKIILPKTINRQKKGEEEKEQQRLAYGQFKKIYDNRGDNVSATQYLSLEMEVYRNELTQQIDKMVVNRDRIFKRYMYRSVIRLTHEKYSLKKIKLLLYILNWLAIIPIELSLLAKKQWWNIQGERVNLWLNYFSNYHSNNWVRAVIITTLMTLYCFWIYCMLLGYGIGNDWKKAFELLSYSLEFLNPLRKADFLKDSLIMPVDECKSFKGFARFWDYFSRIIIAYFVYQTIQAFRRFGKTK